MKIAILGYASQGAAAYRYWSSGDHEITICDQNPKLSAPTDTTTQLGKKYLENLDQYDLLVRTPALHPKNILAANPKSPHILDKVTTVTDEFMRVCPTKNIIGVTGTKGKGTTSTLIAKMLEAAGKRVHLGGNIGIPPLEMLKNDIQPDDWVVLELANFQLIDLKISPHIGVCLMVEPEHMDWHEDIEEYIAAKQQLFINQSEQDIAIYYAKNENSEAVASATEGTLIPYFEEPGATVEDNYICIGNKKVVNVSEIKLLGEHNWQNVCAALTAFWQIKKDLAAAKTITSNFGGLPFRIERRLQKKGITFYNDSFATANGATIAAIKAIPEKKVLIIGGFDRGLNLEHLVGTIQHEAVNIRKVLVIGASAQRLKQAFDQAKFANYQLEPAQTMPEIISSALQFAKPGDAVVLSPGFASFDMFKNFEDRGQQFNKAVDEL